MLVVINPVASGGKGVAERLARLVDEISSDPGVRLPGRRGQTARRQALEHGIDVEDEVIATICEL